MKDQQINELAQKYHDGTITEQEKELFLQWYNSFNESTADIDMEGQTMPEELRKKIWSLVSAQTSPSAPKIYRSMYKYAAAIVVVMAIAGSYFLYHQTQPEVAVNTSSEARSKEEDALPGINTAILTLSDGTTLQINNTTPETIHDGALSIVNRNGELSYAHETISAINTMSTPKGGQYKLTLADDTKVWLNAASSITYPTAFNGKTREVSISGEVYFEVAPNKQKPFVVAYAGSKVQVLGTSFNITAYKDETTHTITLIDGAVQVEKGKDQILLKPGQQVMDKTTLELHTTPDIKQVMAWKNGAFNFNGQDFSASMRQLERWYDIEVVYDGVKPSGKFWGEVDRNLKLSQALRILDGVVARFKLEGRKLHVLPNKS